MTYDNLMSVGIMEKTTDAMSVPDPLKKNLEWYIANQQELVAKHNGKILLIVDQKLVEVFNSMEEAYAAATKAYTLGSFTLQPCSPGQDSYTLTLYNPIHRMIA